MREAFGTYLDRDIAPLILSGNLPPEGFEVTVSIMFVDVRGFTSFAERSEATEVVAALNALFEVIVPVVTAPRRPRRQVHGRRAAGRLRRARGLPGPRRPRGRGRSRDRARGQRPRRGAASSASAINTGRVVAGSIGGAGRLNFSVIGDAVNVSARVEAATRETGDDLLLTAATRDALTRPLSLTRAGRSRSRARRSSSRSSPARPSRSSRSSNARPSPHADGVRGSGGPRPPAGGLHATHRRRPAGTRARRRRAQPAAHRRADPRRAPRAPRGRHRRAGGVHVAERLREGAALGAAAGRRASRSSS